MKKMPNKSQSKNPKEQGFLVKQNQNPLTILENQISLITKFLHFLFYLQFSLLLPGARSTRVINVDNKDINTISYSSYVKNSDLGYIFYTENQIENVTDSFSDLGLGYSLSSSFLKKGHKAQLELTPKTDFSILNSVYLQQDNKNLTYFKDYFIKFNVDDSVIPYYNFHAEGIKNSSFSDVVYPQSTEVKEDKKEEREDEDDDNKHKNDKDDKPSTNNDANFFNGENNKKEFEEKEFDVSCEYTDNGLIYQAQPYTQEVNFSKIESLEGLNFALTSDKRLVRLFFGAKAPNQPAFSRKNITEDLLFTGNSSNNANESFTPISLRKFDDFYLVNQFYETGTFIFALSANASMLVVYNITYWDYLGNYLVKLFAEVNLQEIFKVNNVVFSPNSNDTSLDKNNLPTITKFGTYKDLIVLSTLEKGLVFLNKNPQSDKWEPKSLTSVSFKNLTENLRIRDMSINNHTIYIICENLGMKIFDLQKLAFTGFEFAHPHLLKFDANFHNNMLSPFYGLLVDNSVAGVNEFFIELKLQDYDEFSPQINRVFISESKSAKNPYSMQHLGKNGLVSFTNQIKLGIVYDRQNQLILLMDRGVPNFVETYTYKINLQRIYSGVNSNSNNYVNNNKNANSTLVISANNTVVDLTNTDNSTINNITSNNFTNSINPQSISDSEIFIFSSETDKFNPAILVKYSNNLSFLITEIKNSNVTFMCEFNRDGDFEINFIYRTACRSDSSRDSYDSYRSCPVFVTVPLQVQGGMNAAIWVIIGVIVVGLIALVSFVVCCFRGKRMPKYPNEGERDVRYAQAESQPGHNHNDKNNSNNNNNKNNDIIEIQIIDDIK